MTCKCYRCRYEYEDEGEVENNFTPKVLMEEGLENLDKYIEEVQGQLIKAEDALKEAKLKRAVMSNMLRQLEERPKMFDNCGMTCY